MDILICFSQVQNGGDGLSIRMVTGNMWNKQSRIADNGQYSGLGIGCWTKNTAQ